MGIKRSGGVVAGTLAPFAGATVPAGWLACAGQAVSRVTYAALFLAIGTQYGAGDGATTFNLPDLRGRAIFGKDDMNGSAANRITNAVSGIVGTTLGASGGGESVTLTTNETPAHTHPMAGSGAGSQSQASAFTSSNVNSGAPYLSGNAGSGGAHRNMPPALVANYIIKT